MLYKIILKNFKSNIRNYILFFVSNIIATAELFAFWGIRDIVMDAVTDESTAFSLNYDFWLAAGLVTMITILLMVFSMKNYIKLRIKDYSMFIILGMTKKMSYLMLLGEYCIGWLVSFLGGLLLGNGVLYGAQYGMHRLYSEFIKITKVDWIVYRNTFRLSFGIMAVVFLALMVWLDTRDLSMLMQEEAIKEKKPISKIWLIFTLAGVGMIMRATDQYQSSNETQYIMAHIEWVIGGLLVIIFGVGVILGVLERCRRFYLRNVLILNQLYSKYQSSMFIVLILFVIHFFALTYISTEIASMLPLDKYRENYPYDVIWMAQEKEQEFADELVEKYNGTIITFPMIRVTTYYTAEHIGVSESSYKELTGKEYQLAGREIVVGIEDQEYQKEEKIQDEDYWEAYQWLYLGKATDELFDFNIDDEQYLYDVRDVHSQSVIGQYSIDQWHENVIIFSDDYFEEQWKRIAGNLEEVSELNLFTFPTKNREKAWKELKAYIDENGVEEIKGHSVVYNTEEFLMGVKMRQLFVLTSKLFILVSLFISAFFVMGLWTLLEVPAYRRRYEFLECMGMKNRMLERTLRFETQCISNIALAAGICMAIIYARSYVVLQSRSGTVVKPEFWKYWIVLEVGYILIEYLIQRLFVRYVICCLRKDNG